MKRLLSIIILISIILILKITYNANCQDISQTVKEISDDFDLIFVVNPKESELLIDKYKDKKYSSIFVRVLSDEKYSDQLLYNIIYLSAVLKNGSYLEYVKNISSSRSAKIEDVIKFYYYRIGYEKVDSINLLRKKLENLIKNPTDSHLITFLPFFQDIDFSLSYSDRLARIADGATSELLSWAVNYLFYKNMNDTQISKKIKKSYSYHKYVLRN